MKKAEFADQAKSLGKRGAAWRGRAERVGKRVWKDENTIPEAIAEKYFHPGDLDSILDHVAQEDFEGHEMPTVEGVFAIIDRVSREMREPIVEGAKRDEAREVIGSGVDLANEQAAFIRAAIKAGASKWVE